MKRKPSKASHNLRRSKFSSLSKCISVRGDNEKYSFK
jgi:hypothetical protein